MQQAEALVKPSLGFGAGLDGDMAVAYNKKRLFLIALPMGFVDFLVPFAGQTGIIVFEATIFALSVLSLAIALIATKQIRKSSENQKILKN